MTREMTPAMAAAVQGVELHIAYLLDLEFTDQTVRVWTGTDDLVWKGNTYIGAGVLLSIGDSQESVNLTGETIRYGLSGVNPALLAVALAENYQGRPVKLHMGLFNPATNQLIDDPLRVSAGYIDTMNIDDAEDSATISMTVENELATLSRTNIRRRTEEDHRLNHPTDSFFTYLDYLPQVITW